MVENHAKMPRNILVPDLPSTNNSISHILICIEAEIEQIGLDSRSTKIQITEQEHGNNCNRSIAVEKADYINMTNCNTVSTWSLGGASVGKACRRKFCVSPTSAQEGFATVWKAWDVRKSTCPNLPSMQKNMLHWSSSGRVMTSHEQIQDHQDVQRNRMKKWVCKFHGTTVSRRKTKREVGWKETKGR